MINSIIERTTTPDAAGTAARRGARRGSSLVEMVIAIVVLGAVLISMLGMFLISRAAVSSKEDETANSLALRCLEVIETRPFTDFATAGPLNIDDIKNKFKETQYSAAAQVLSSDSYSAIVKVEVGWIGAGPSPMGGRKVVLERVISAGGHKNVGQ